MKVSEIRKAVATFMSTLVTLPAFLAVIEGKSPFSWEVVLGAVITAAAAGWATYRIPNAPPDPE